jgi:hypothetical protein
VPLSLKFGGYLIVILVVRILTFSSLDNDIIVLRGGENEASSQVLSGTVVLCLPHALKVEDVHLRMVGSLKAWLVFPLRAMPLLCTN